VRETVRNYIEGHYTGDAQRMGHTLHPHYLKHVLHGNIPVREKTGNQMLAEVRSQGPANLPPADRTEQISVLDIAKLVTPHLGRLHDAFEAGRRMEDSLSCSADRRLNQIPKLRSHPVAPACCPEPVEGSRRQSRGHLAPAWLESKVQILRQIIPISDHTAL
jgi:hypothetical protein